MVFAYLPVWMSVSVIYDLWTFPKPKLFYVVGIEGGSVVCTKKSLVGWKSRRSRELLYALFLQLYWLSQLHHITYPIILGDPHYFLSFSHPLFFFCIHMMHHTLTLRPWTIHMVGSKRNELNPDSTVPMTNPIIAPMRVQRSRVGLTRPPHTAQYTLLYSESYCPLMIYTYFLE